MMNKKYHIILNLSFLTIFGLSNVDAQQIKLIDEDVKINDDGSANIKLKLDVKIENASSMIKIPALQGNSSEMNSQIYTDNSELIIHQENRDNYSFLEIKNRLPIGHHSFTIQYVLPEFLDWSFVGPGEFSAYKFSVDFDNPFIMQIDTFNLTVSLPKGWNYHKIIDSNPIFRDEDPQPPYKFFKSDDGLYSVNISRTEMKFKDSIGLTFLFKKTSKSIFIIIIAIIIAGLYMITFRELIINNRISIDENKE